MHSVSLDIFGVKWKLPLQVAGLSMTITCAGITLKS